MLETIERVAFGLQALHDAQIVHRDVKPSNILICADGSPKLIDFGIAQMPESPDVDASVVQGTIPYMSPEQAAGSRVDFHSDLYSLGVVMFEWLAGLRPLRPRGDSFAEQARDLLRRRPLRLAELRPDLPAGVDRLVSDLLAKLPKRRPASALEVADRCRHSRQRL